MSQPRGRKMLGSGAEMPRALTSAAKPSGDSMTCPLRPHQDIFLSRSKNKIPKSVRYDLENALVGLCDVWFEVIKPHLVRNNIKLHVNGSSAGGDHERLSPASRDRAPPPATSARAPPPATTARAPPPAPLALDCSHLDPGAAPDHLRRAASCVGSSSTPPTASRAPCARLRMPSCRPLSPLLSVPQTPRDCPQIQSLNCEEKKLERRCIRRKRRRFQPQPQPSWQVPRLCRTYTVLCRARAGSGSHTTMIASPPQPPRDDHYRFIVPRRESVMKNKTTQIEEALFVSRGCQSRSPGSRDPDSRRPGPCSPDSRRPGPCSPDSRRPGPCSPDSLCPGPCSPNSRRPGPCSPDSRRPGPCSPNSRRPGPCSPDSRRSGPCSPDSRRPGPRSPTCNSDHISSKRASPPPTVPSHIVCRRPEATVAEIPPLLQDDLIDIIAEGNERRLRLLYSSSEKDSHPSYMNLFPNSQKEKRGLKKLPPWR